VMVSYCSESVFSNVWWPFKLNNSDTRLEKSLVVWMNSSLGILTLLTIRGETQGAWIKFKKFNLEQMPVLDVNALSEEQVEILSNTFDDIANEPLQPFPEMEDDPMRAKIDGAIQEVFGFPDMRYLRKVLADEPTICLKRKAAHLDA